ncbi:MAG TPA: MFS transporter [Anaerolineae bacterium]|nr:MFS transporter [Anaerolineae bacterium]
MSNLSAKLNFRESSHRAVWAFTVTLLLIEFLDELTFGVEGAVLPTIRTELGLSYEQIGLLLSLPRLVGNIVEPALGILGDVWKRKVIVVGGGLMFALAVLLTGLSQTFVALLIAFALFNPSSGAFVSLSQATLMDLNPARREQMMARWTLAGSLGVVSGPLLVSGALALNLGWRGLYLSLAIVTLALVWGVWRQPDLNGRSSNSAAGFRKGLRSAWRAVRDRNIIRWLALLESADLMLDVLLGFIALYFVDVVGVSEIEAGIAVAVWSAASLIGDALIIPLLERVRSLTYLRRSAVIELALYVALLLVPDVTAKYVLLALLALGNSGWYAILKGRLYSAMPGQSGTSMAVSSATGIIGGLIPWGLGLVAQSFGLPVAMSLLALGPISLLIGLPRVERRA